VILLKRLRELRERKGLTLEQVATELGLRNQYISNYELGKRNPDYETLKKFADFYGVTTDYILDNSDIENPYIINPLTNKRMTKKEKKQYKDYIQEVSLFFNDEDVSDEDKELFMMSLNKIFWEAKKINKEKYAKSHDKIKNKE